MKKIIKNNKKFIAINNELIFDSNYRIEKFIDRLNRNINNTSNVHKINI